jgi:alkaline phosphatase D
MASRARTRDFSSRSTITSDLPSVLAPFIQAALPDNPHTVFFEGYLHGYVRFQVTPDLWRAEYRAVPTTQVDDVDATTIASFVTIDGVPGAMAG